MTTVRTSQASLIAMLTLALIFLCTASPLCASTPSFAIEKQSRSLGEGALHESLLAAMTPRCDLEITRSRFASGDTVLASWRLLNPGPTSVSVEIKIWFTAPGQAPYSLSGNLDNGKPLALPASLDEETGMTELFAVNDETARGTYEISCRLLDPVTGHMYSEDLNDFQID